MNYQLIAIGVLVLITVFLYWRLRVSDANAIRQQIRWAFATDEPVCEFEKRLNSVELKLKLIIEYLNVEEARPVAPHLIKKESPL